MISARRFVTLFSSLLLMVGSASASTIIMLSAGNGTGLTDGAHYVGFATLQIDGKNYSAICIDSLHDALIGQTWSGIVTPLTDIADLTPIIQAQFNTSITAAAFDPKLGADVVGFFMMLGNSSNASVIDLQHGVWGQFDPRYDGKALAAESPSILTAGWMAGASGGGPTSVSINNFYLVTDSTNANQAFIITSTPTPEPLTVALMGAGLILLGLFRRRASNLRSH